MTRTELRDRIETRCFLTDGPYNLSNGSVSDYYFDCKRATLDGRTLWAIADAFITEIDQLPEQPTAIGGLTVGADPLIAAILMRHCCPPAPYLSYANPIVSGCIVRKERKAHGTQSLIENELPKGTPIVMVDDVLTTGSSIMQACKALISAGCRIVGIVVLIDRRDQVGYPVRAIFTKKDFPKLNQ